MKMNVSPRGKNNSKTLKKDTRAQIQVMEIITAGLIMMSVLNFVATLSIPTSSSVGHDDHLSILVFDTMKMSANMQAENESYSSMLDEQICTDNIISLVEMIDGVLDKSFSFNIYLVDAGSNEYIIYDMGSNSGSTVVSHLLVTLSSGEITQKETHTSIQIDVGVYDLRIQVWNEPRLPLEVNS